MSAMKCRRCNHVHLREDSEDWKAAFRDPPGVWRDIDGAPRCRRCQWGFCRKVRDPRRLATDLLTERVQIIEA